MDFRFTEDQQDLIDAAKTVFDGENTVERMRAIVAGDSLDDLWPQFAELGLLGLMAPESSGGLQQPLVVMSAIAEAAGYAGLSEPFVEIAGITVPNCDEEYIEGLISGEAKFALSSKLRPYIDTKLSKGKVVNSALNSIDPLRLLVKLESPKEGAANVTLHGAVLCASQLIGVSKRMLDMSVDYAKDRHQFGKAIGSFQAIKHQLANVHTQIEFTRPIVQLAAIKGGAAVHNAKVAANDMAVLAAETAIQVHGGMGYTYEVDLHLFMKRAWALCGEWGDRNYHMKKLEDYVFGDETSLGPGATFA